MSTGAVLPDDRGRVTLDLTDLTVDQACGVDIQCEVGDDGSTISTALSCHTACRRSF
jgi:hypothetical protein